ncbi:hypothetical protein K439DRAFT_1141806 [Ramaria rubella]|nr:hypothetical protein K439DRAFT_1141806 [Ramaria rubella]
MSKKEYSQAIHMYTEAILLDATNPVYYSNQKAIEVDPIFVKAFSRLGHAHYSLGDFVSASSAFQRGLALEPENANLRSGLDQADARIRADSPPPVVEDEVSTSTRSSTGASGMPDLSGMANMLGGMGGGASGMPDIASIMSNPAIMQMAQNMMANGGMDRLMQNPALANMMNRVQSGGGMPSMQELMSDPSLRDLASSLGGGVRTSTER